MSCRLAFYLLLPSYYLKKLEVPTGWHNYVVGGSIPPDLTLPSTLTITPILKIILNVGLCPGRKERRGEDMR